MWKKGKAEGQGWSGRRGSVLIWSLTCQFPRLKWNSSRGKATSCLFPVSTGQYLNRPFTHVISLYLLCNPAI